jgi:hypothetical protein
MIVGAIGLVMSTLIFGSWRNRSVGGPAVVERNNTVVDRNTYPSSTPVTEERVYRDQL